MPPEIFATMGVEVGVFSALAVELSFVASHTTIAFCCLTEIFLALAPVAAAALLMLLSAAALTLTSADFDEFRVIGEVGVSTFSSTASVVLLRMVLG